MTDPLLFPAPRRAVPSGRAAEVPGIDLAAARGNTLLNGLADDDLAELLGAISYADLTLGAVLYEPGLPVATVHFPLSGVVSTVADLGGGEIVEAATVGSEGMPGISVFLGAGPPTEPRSR